MTAIDLDDDFASAGRRKPAAELPQLWLPNGLYTLTFPCGTHKTLRIHTQQVGKLAGRRLISLLIGPSNTDDYETIAELTPVKYYVWKRYQGKRPADYVELLWILMKGEKLEGHEVILSKRCYRCNQPLTDPESAMLGIGPECRRKERA